MKKYHENQLVVINKKHYKRGNKIVKRDWYYIYYYFKIKPSMFYKENLGRSIYNHFKKHTKKTY